MKITQDVRDYAAKLNEAGVELAEETTQVDPDSNGREAGMAQMSAKFREMGGRGVRGCRPGEEEQRGAEVARRTRSRSAHARDHHHCWAERSREDELRQ